VSKFISHCYEFDVLQISLRVVGICWMEVFFNTNNFYWVRSYFSSLNLPAFYGFSVYQFNTVLAFYIFVTNLTFAITIKAKTPHIHTFQETIRNSALLYYVGLVFTRVILDFYGIFKNTYISLISIIIWATIKRDRYF